MASAVPPRALVLLLVLTLVWGTNWPLFPIVMREMSVWTFRGVSMPAAGLLLLAIAHLRGQSLRVPRQHWGPVAAATFSYLVVWNVASGYSAILIPSGQSAVLGFTMPLWAALISWAVLGERLGRRLWLAVALGAVGVALLMARSIGAYAQAPLGLALGTLIIKRARIDVPATVLTGWQLLLASLPVIAGAFALGDGHWAWPPWTTILLVAYIVVMPMGLGNVTWFSIVGLLPANLAGLSSILVPVVAMISGALVHGEPLGPLQWLAMACCGGALALALFKPAAKSA